MGSEVHPEGFGAPFAKVFNDSREMQVKVKNFTYSHDEEKDDSCTISIEDTDVTLPDKEEFQEGAKLHVIWGYVVDNWDRRHGIPYRSSQRRIVYVRNIKATFNRQGVILTLTCYDKLSRARQVTSQKVHKDVTIEDVAKANAEKHGLEYISQEDLEGTFELINTRNLSILNEDANNETSIDETSHRVLVDFRKYVVLPQGNKSDKDLMDDMAMREPGGPWVVDGRDDKITVRKRNLNQKPIKTYEFGGGNFELLSFTPETKGRAKAASSINIETAGFNAKLKEVIQSNSNIISNANSEDFLGEEADGSVRGSEVEKSTETDVDNIEPELADTSGTNPGGKLFADIPFHTVDPTDLSILDDGGSWTSEVDNTAVKVNVGTSVGADQNTHLDTVGDAEEAQAWGDNARASSALKKNPGTAVCIGDPNVVSGKVITIFNVSKKYSGNYYIISATHNPNHPGGYVMTLKLTRNAVGSIKAKQTGKVNTTALSKNRKQTRVIVNKEVGPQQTKEQGRTIPEAEEGKPSFPNQPRAKKNHTDTGSQYDKKQRM